MVHNFIVKDSDGNDVSLSKYKGKVLLIVNTATQCGLTPQYDGLQKLYEQFHSRGFEVLDFPCNQFLNQAPGSDKEISQFCEVNFHTTFPRFKKIDVNGKDTHPLFAYLKKSSAAELEDIDEKSFVEKLKALGQTILTPEIKWNFTKFLVDREGKVVKRYSPAFKPENIAMDIIAELDKVGGQSMNIDDTTKLLRECDSGTKMAVTSIDDVLDNVKSEKLKQILIECKNKHSVLGNELHSRLKALGEDEKDPSAMAKSMSWMKTNMKLAMEESDNTIADLITEGSNMGVKSLSRYLNEYKDADDRAKKLCRDLIIIEEDLAKSIREFL